MMSARSRGRANPNQDADEERRLWKEIKDKAREVDTQVARSNQIGREILDVEAKQAAFLNDGKSSDAALDEQLEKLYRENVKICEEVQHIMEGKSNDMNLLDSINILAGLREASEESAAQMQASQGHRAASGKLARTSKKAGGKVASAIAASTEDGDEGSAAPSPKISLNPHRLHAKEKTSRSGSIATTREASVKIEDGAESVASSADGASTATGPTKASAGGRPTNRVVLKQGEIVFCRHDPKHNDPNNPVEGEGILCRVTNVIGEGKQRRYEVQDADTQGDPPPPQRASISQLFAIPNDNKGLPDLPAKKAVVAQYPDTTTFYKAEVSESWRAKDASGDSGIMVKLNFEDDPEVREVERRFVLPEK